MGLQVQVLRTERSGGEMHNVGRQDMLFMHIRCKESALHVPFFV